jgi:hypothetical protein
MQPFIDDKAHAIVSATGCTQDFNFQSTNIESRAVGEVMVPVSKTSFFALSDFSTRLPPQVE